LLDLLRNLRIVLYAGYSKGANAMAVVEAPVRYHSKAWGEAFIESFNFKNQLTWAAMIAKIRKIRINVTHLVSVMRLNNAYENQNPPRIKIMSIRANIKYFII
jgi:hypothetical protein